MVTLAVVEIAGKQYKIVPNQEFLVNYLGDVREHKCDKVLLAIDDDKLDLGRPYLKKELTFKVLGEVNDEKIRVAKFHAKANYRRVKGSKQKYTKLVLA